MNKLLEAPLPIFLGGIAQVLPEGMTENVPGWGMGLIAGVFLVAYVMEKTGYMPHKNGKDAHPIDFTEDDRTALKTMAVEVKKVTDLLAGRGPSGIERVLTMSSAIESHGELLEKIVELQSMQLDLAKSQAEHLKVLAENSVRRA